MNQMIPAGQFNRIAYFYAQDSSTNIGLFSKDAVAYVMCRLDYSGLATPPGTETESFSVDIGSNPPLAVSSSSYNQAGKHVDFIVSGGVEGQQYNLTVTITGTINRSDVITFDVPLTVGECGSVATSPNVTSYSSGAGMVFVNSAIKYTVGPASPSGANIKDQWYNSATGTLYEYITDGVSFWWQQITPNLGATFLTYKMQTLAPDGFTTDFTLLTVGGKTPDVLASTDLIVSVDNVIQNPDLQYRAFGNIIQFTTPPAADSVIFITWFAHY